MLTTDTGTVLSKMTITAIYLILQTFTNVSVKPIAAYKIEFTEVYNDINIKHEKRWQLVRKRVSAVFSKSPGIQLRSFC